MAFATLARRAARRGLVRPRHRPERFASSEASFASVVIEPVQAGILALYETSGLPWWATLGVAAIGVRSAFLPVGMASFFYVF